MPQAAALCAGAPDVTNPYPYPYPNPNPNTRTTAPPDLPSSIPSHLELSRALSRAHPRHGEALEEVEEGWLEQRAHDKECRGQAPLPCGGRRRWAAWAAEVGVAWVGVGVGLGWGPRPRWRGGARLKATLTLTLTPTLARRRRSPRRRNLRGGTRGGGRGGRADPARTACAVGAELVSEGVRGGRRE